MGMLVRTAALLFFLGTTCPLLVLQLEQRPTPTNQNSHVEADSKIKEINKEAAPLDAQSIFRTAPVCVGGRKAIAQDAWRLTCVYLPH